MCTTRMKKRSKRMSKLMCDTKYNNIPKDTLLNLVLDMGRVIRDGA